ncbi:integral membrane protein [Coniella lustricola]|uniref:Integral membrane protein n=1 Tax=Coniella lustricola TaxID=2025994 RepID=A0A2T3AHR4_9PEZI|nr:integral membrane protein [Coniella lustricola]
MHKFTSLAIVTLTVNWTLTFLAFISVVITYIFRRKGGMLEEVLTYSAFLIGTILVAISSWAIVDEGQGAHQWNLSQSQVAKAAKSLLVAEALWSLVNSLLRNAAGLLILRISGPMSGIKRAACLIMAASIALAIVSSMEIFLICRPFAAQWDPLVLGTCGDQILSFTVLETVGLALDLVILALPAIFMVRLQTTKWRRIKFILVVDAGSVVLVITALRMAALRNAVSPDFSYSQSYLSLLSAAGSMTGVVCCASFSIRTCVLKVAEFGKSSACRRRYH